MCYLDRSPTFSLLNANNTDFSAKFKIPLNENKDLSLAKNIKGFMDISKDTFGEILLMLSPQDIFNIEKTNLFLYELVDEKLCQNYLTHHYPQCLHVGTHNCGSIPSHKNRLRILALGKNLFMSKWGEAVQINIKYEDRVDLIFDKYVELIDAQSHKNNMSREDWHLKIQFVLFGEKYTLQYYPRYSPVGDSRCGRTELFNHNKNTRKILEYFKNKFSIPISAVTINGECILFAQHIYILGPKKILRNQKLGPNKSEFFSL
jgi:hypothetical protein